MKTVKMILLTAVLTLVWGCSSDSDSDSTTAKYTFASAVKPSWSVDLSGSDTAPGWQDIDRSLYESWMYVTVKLQDELAAHAGTGDLMVALIGDECRTRPAMPSDKYADGSVYFVLTIGGNEADRDAHIKLCYYSAALHSLFTIEAKETFAPESSYGNTADYVPLLLQGSKKYSVQQQLTVNLPAKVPFTTSADDLVAVFAGNECRGVGSIGKPFTVFRTSAGEALQVRYYSTVKAGIYSFTQNMTQNENTVQTMTLDF